jgi:hypothetical protein
MMTKRTTYADAQRAAGRREAAAHAFADAERRQKEWQPEYPLLYSLHGYLYCDLLLAKGDYVAARDRAEKAIVIALGNSWLLDIALDTLILGRSHRGLALAAARTDQMSATVGDDARTAHVLLNEAVDGLRAAGQSDDLPRGLLCRAAVSQQYRRLGGRRARS